MLIMSIRNTHAKAQLRSRETPDRLGIYTYAFPPRKQRTETKSQGEFAARITILPVFCPLGFQVRCAGA